MSAVSQKSTLAVLKIMAATIAVEYEDEALSSAVLKSLRTWNSEAQEFLTRFKIRKPMFVRLVQSLMKGQDFEDDLDTFADTLKLKMDILTKETDITKDQLKLLKNIVSISKRGSETALKNFHKSVQLLGEPHLTAMFKHKQTVDQSKTIKDLDTFCMRTMKKKFADLTLEDRDTLREKKPDLYKTYLKLNRDISQAIKDAIRDNVRQSGSKLIKISEMVRLLSKAKIQNKLPAFDGMIDETGAIYNKLGVKLNGSVTGRIELNPAYNPKTDDTYVFLHYPLFGAGLPQRVYTVNYKQSKTVSKFGIVDELIKKVPAMRKKWLADLTGPIGELNTVCALILELTYITSARIGTANSATGLSTLVCKEFLSTAANAFTLSYTGKSGVKQKHVIPTVNAITKKLKRMLLELKKGKKPSDYLMTYGPKKALVTGSKVNSYLKSVGAPEGATIHKFRHMRGTLLAQVALAKHPFGKGKAAKESEVNKWILEKLKSVGEKLGHMNGDKVTATTAIQNYIDPNILKDWFAAIGVRPNSAIQAAIDRASKVKG